MTKEEIKKAKTWLTPVFRVSHPHLFKPSAMKPGAPEYFAVEMLFDKTKVTRAEIEKPLMVAAKERWGDNPKEWPPLKNPIKDGDKPAGKKREVKPEHKGCWVVKASTKAEYGKPAVMEKDGETEITNAAAVYPGCNARALVMASAYTNPEKDGVSFILDGVQKHSDGVALGGKKPGNQMFGTIEDEGGDASESDSAGFSFGEEAADETADGESFF